MSDVFMTCLYVFDVFDVFLYTVYVFDVFQVSDVLGLFFSVFNVFDVSHLTYNRHCVLRLLRQVHQRRSQARGTLKFHVSVGIPFLFVCSERRALTYRGTSFPATAAGAVASAVFFGVCCVCCVC